MKNELRLSLQPHFFTEKERGISEWSGLKASLFKYDSGVCAIRVTNKRGEIIMLPYQGQQIWHCTFDNRKLHMKSIFKTPQPTDKYLENYGGFFLHCGITAFGVPSPEDTHPLHGELPNAPYQEAYITHGHDAKGCFMAIGGTYTHKMAFNHHYRAEPTVKIYEDSALLDVSLEITNLSHIPMDAMYLAHINFRPVDYARLAYTAPYDPQHVAVNASIPKHIKSGVAADDFLAFAQKLKDNPVLHHTVDPAGIYDPEVVMTIKYHADKEGLAHSLQLHPDGYAHYVSHRPDQLDRALRWIARHPNHDAMGLVLPCNAGGGGYLAEKAAGSIKTLAPGAQMRFDMQMGLLEPDSAEDVMRKIEANAPTQP